MQPGYQFGDSDLAAERLAEVARVFDDSTRRFIRQVADRSFQLVVDLGCGPGFTTRILADLLRSGRTVGLDTSVHFLDLARRYRTPGVEYFEHDVCRPPFPSGPADLLYCRFLLSHIQDVRSALRTWATQLEPGGLLLWDEVESIRTSNHSFKSYLSIVERMLDASGSKLYIGPDLASSYPSERLRLVRSDIRTMAVANRDAAAMFSRNVLNWRANTYVRANYRDAEIDELLDRLRIESGAPESRSEITWELRQVILQQT